MVALKLAAVANGLASVKVATTPVKGGAPSVAAIVMPVPVSGASVMLAVLLAEAMPPPSPLVAPSSATGPLLTLLRPPPRLTPPPLADTPPAEDVPSPQVIVAVKSPAVANGLAS